jgi:hypothetical protein
MNNILDVYVVSIIVIIGIPLTIIFLKMSKTEKNTVNKQKNERNYEEQFKNNIIRILEIIKKEKGDIKKELDILSDLADLKMKEYKNKIVNDDICVICLENLKVNMTIKKCNHVFHMDCLKNWHKTNRNCPVCRK